MFLTRPMYFILVYLILVILESKPLQSKKYDENKLLTLKNPNTLNDHDKGPVSFHATW